MPAGKAVRAEMPPGDPERNETPIEQLDRNWTELLQELRVVQTGVQLLTGFLLTLPFDQRFTTLDSAQRSLYLATVTVAAASTVLLIAPVALHRALFRRHARGEQVALAHRLALAGSAMLGLAICGVVVLIFEVVAGTAPAIVAGVAAFAVVASAWVALPMRARRVAGSRASPGPAGRSA
jgi:hypothetical protein